MVKFITEIKVSQNKSEEEYLQGEQFTKIPTPLSDGPKEKSYLWYKTGNASPITIIQFSFDKTHNQGLSKAKYQKLDNNLNQGTSGDPIHLWYSTDPSKFNVPITELKVSTDLNNAAKYKKNNWKLLFCDLNQDPKNKKMIYLWVKRAKPTYIKEIIASKSEDEWSSKGYIRLSGDINTESRKKPVFLWYKPTEHIAEAIRDLKISINKNEFKQYDDNKYDPVDQDLNEMTGGNQVYLWYNRSLKGEGLTPIIDLAITGEITKKTGDWETLAHELNPDSSKPKIHLWMKRDKPTYIKDIIATKTKDDVRSNGYLPLYGNGDINTESRKKPVFLWYQPTDNVDEAIWDLQLSINEEQFESYKNKYDPVDQDLNEMTGRNQVYLWFKKGPPVDKSPITELTVTADKPKDVTDGKMVTHELNPKNKSKSIYLLVKSA